MMCAWSPRFFSACAASSPNRPPPNTATVFALAMKEFAGQLPEIGTINLTPDLITQAIGMLAEGLAK